MVEQFQGIQSTGVLRPDQAMQTPANGPQETGGQDFKTYLMDSIQEVNRLQAEAEQARIGLATGKTENVAEVFTAVKKAELAFQTLMQIRNKLMDAYDEIKQMRV
jgi:flagellar hook-basal body complex protein FliE